MGKAKNKESEFYHVYNRGVDKRNVFVDKFDVDRFLQSMVKFNTVEPVGSLYELSLDIRHGRRTSISRPLVNIICFCLNLNHYHFVLEEVEEGGVSEFMKRLGGGYTKYFNTRYKRSGALFQGKFQHLFIDSNEYLLRVSAYVNLNNLVHKIKAPMASSWGEYISGEGLCKKEIILSQFQNQAEYQEFAEEALENIWENKAILKKLEKENLH